VTPPDYQIPARRKRPGLPGRRAKFALANAALLGVLLAYGCAGKPPAAPPKPAAAETKAAEETKVQPAPRVDLDATPDLSHAVYAVNAAALAALARNGVPADVVTSLRKLDGKTFAGPVEFLKAARDAAGQGPVTKHQEAILRGALLVTPADPPQGPRGESSQEEARARSQIVSMPATRVVLKPTEFKIVTFDFDKYDIRPEWAAAVQENARRLISRKLAVVIEGHCDEHGTNEYNLALGQRRAESMRQALLAAGVPTAQLKTLSYGEERPADPGHDPAAWARNRRAVLTAE